MNDDSAIVAIEVLSKTASLAESDSLNAVDVNLEDCRQWFADHGIVLSTSSAGLSGTASVASLKDAFGLAAPLEPPVLASVPPELEEAVDQIWLYALPELF